MKELLQNNTIIADVAWDIIIRVALVFCVALYAIVTRNKSENDGIIEKLDTFTIGLFIIGAFPVLAIVGIYKGLGHLIKRRNEKRCYSQHTEGTFTYSLTILFRENGHLMVNKYETIVEYYWDKQNGFCEKMTLVGYEKVFMAPKNRWEEIYREESVDSNLEDERVQSHRYERVKLAVKQY
ncbi:MAG: hypothetical protein K5920_05225 [Bacteroidales bacterium]|nr:hypothetical protein [Bacteroidales bacterium]